VTSQYALGTLWESWQNSQGEGGSSMNHAFMGGGIGEWFYEYALGLRYRHRRAVDDRDAAARRRCSVPTGISDALAFHSLRLSASEVCSLVDVTALRQSEPPASLSQLRATARAALRGPPTPVALVPEAALLLDGKIVPALRSARGHLDTVQGRLAAAWNWTERPNACPHLVASLSASGALHSSVVIHKALLDRFSAAGTLCSTAAPVLVVSSAAGVSLSVRVAALLEGVGVGGRMAIPSFEASSSGVEVRWVAGTAVHELDSADATPWLSVSLPRTRAAAWTLQLQASAELALAEEQ